MPPGRGEALSALAPTAPRIAGIVGEAGGQARPALVTRLLEALAAGRPVTTAVVQGGQAALGWCGGPVAVATASPGVLVVVDGHVYNRSELPPAENDAALVAALHARHGFAGALQRLNGDFAVALYEPAGDVLWLGRDRFGVKPLYYARAGAALAFASRPRPLLDVPGVAGGVNRRFVALFAASHYRYFDNAPDESPYASVAQLPAGRVLRFAGGRATVSPYWSLADSPELTESEEALAERYRALLLDAVALRLRAARRPVFTLSGGMDSSSVLALAAHVAGAAPPALSAIYEDKTYDESSDIRPLVEEMAVPWRPVSVATPDVLGLVGRMVAAHDEPVATATWLSHFLLCEAAARDGFGSLFGGLGGDELNAGEYEYFFFHFADLRAAGREDELSREIERWIRHHDHPVFRKSREVADAGLRRLVDLRHPGRCLPDRARLERYAAALEPSFFDLRGFAPVMDHPFTGYLKNRTYQDIFRETAPCCLRAEDRQTAAFGLDHFLPFFDHRLAELMFRVPGRLKIRDGVTKHLLRQAMRGVLPEATRTRIKKTGWNAPAHVWFAGPGRGPLLDLVRSRAFRERGIYRMAEVERLVDEHDAIVTSAVPAENHMMFLWQLVNLELWLQGARPA